jgi:hypothetical protein
MLGIALFPNVVGRLHYQFLRTRVAVRITWIWVKFVIVAPI